MIKIDHDWEAYRARWPRNHRRNLRKATERLRREGGLNLSIHSQLSPDQVEPLLKRCLELEDRSWKGEAGTSVLRTPEMFPFFLRQAQRLAQWGQLELAMLEHRDELIAFEYAYGAKGVHHSLKVGYDPRYASRSPGQLLTGLLLEEFHRQPHRRAYDCLGPMSDADAKWLPDAYRVSRLVVAPRRLLSRVLMHAYKYWWPRFRRLRSADPRHADPT